MRPTNQARLLELARHSVTVIRANQATSGAYTASPNFPVYRYSWFRDGAFIADAMSRAGHATSAEAFFGWCAAVLVARSGHVSQLLERHRNGTAIPNGDFLHTRYTLDGRESDAVWENFQLDGFGTWLWALDAHCRRHGRSIDRFAAGAALSVAYIGAFWNHPSYDWWEEHADHRHTSTLAALHAGLRAAVGWPDLEADLRASAAREAAAIARTVLADAGRRGHLTKWLGGDVVDASLLACGMPFGLLELGDPLVTATVARIESELTHGNGVHRYAADTYYGGGEWLLLGGFRGWHLAAVGRRDDAMAQLRWMADQATLTGDLPEQVDHHLLAPAARQAWLDRWGPVATPLLWSHAMFLTLALELGIVTPAQLREDP
jgi:GH15 family glucan-1,4-alpha-glucosidase